MFTLHAYSCGVSLWPRSVYHLHAGTAVVTAGVTAMLLFYDWGAQGQDTAFSGIRPAMRRALTALYDSGGDAGPPKSQGRSG